GRSESLPGTAPVVGRSATRPAESAAAARSGPGVLPSSECVPGAGLLPAGACWPRERFGLPKVAWVASWCPPGLASLRLAWSPLSVHYKHAAGLHCLFRFLHHFDTSDRPAKPQRTPLTGGRTGRKTAPSTPSVISGS